MPYSPIPNLVRLGYTWREAAFLFLVGVNSGFFLRRQYCDFLNRKLGSLAQQLTEKGAGYGHIEALGYGQRRHVYHLKSRTLYRLLGNEESQSRRLKGDAEIKTRLMVLDYVLTNREEPCLTLEQEKIDFFINRFKVTQRVLPHVAFAACGRRGSSAVRYFPDCFPIYHRGTATKSGPDVRFTYFDYGTSTIKPFLRFLERHKALLEGLGAFEIVYVAESSLNFLAANRAFYRLFPKTSDLLPFGLDHLVRFFQAQVLWDKSDPKFSKHDLAVLKEGERVYTLADHRKLQSAWLKSGKQFDAQLAQLGEKQLEQGSLTTQILEGIYPIFGNRYRGKPAEKATKSQIEPISTFKSVAS